MHRRSFCVTFVASLSFLVVGFAPAAGPSSSAKWEGAIRAFEVADKESLPPAGAVLFVGSSSIRFWKTLPQDFPQYNVINRGFGGSQIADSTYFADRIVIPYRPSVIVLHAGANDLSAGKAPRQVYDDFRAFVDKVHSALPETPIAFLSINPTPARWAQAEKQKETNGLIQRYIAGKSRLAYLDQWNALLGPDGQPRADLHIKDRLHPNAAGYKIRTQIVSKYLESLNLPKK
ncbi:MAG TPA: GDSL-type esterase/lipase family protein [Planctomycetaceae bacterium]|jgi:lysophospholipase L1-like esterase|nr:GDSL-type esterase/lipase family protein [Planctomycetaceae bacterium]